MSNKTYHGWTSKDEMTSLILDISTRKSNYKSPISLYILTCAYIKYYVN